MKADRKRNHELLVASYGQQAETHMEFSRILWKLLDGISEYYQRVHANKEKDRFHQEMSTYPDYLLDDLGLSAEEISQIRLLKAKQGVGISTTCFLAGPSRN